MGFSGGGSNVLLPHTHDGTVSQDGGALNFNNVTQSQSASGEIFFSDGVHLQQLPIGAPNDEIRVSAGNLPEWHTPAAASATWDVLYDSGVLGVAGPLTCTFSAPNRFIKVFFYGATVASTTQGITFNNSNGAVEYAFQSQRDFTTLVQFNAERCVFISGGFSTSNPMFSEMAFYNQDDTADKLIHLNTVVNATTGNTFPVSYQDFGKWYGGATITRLDLTDSGGTAINWKAGSRLLVLATG
jgi:hypothetical protein